MTRKARLLWPEKDGLFREERLAGLAVPHGFTHRSLGDMKEAPCREAALRPAGLAGDPLLLKQVHGRQVHRAVPGLVSAKGDGWVSDIPGLCVGVYAADCLPIFMWSGGAKQVGVFHAGWRGLAAGMPKKAVDSFARFGRSPRELSAAVGPHIGPCCYEVGPELKSRFRAGSISEENGLRFDLGEESRIQLVEAGMDPERITVSSDCTSCGEDRFFSYRREGRARRMLAFIAVPA